MNTLTMRDSRHLGGHRGGDAQLGDDSLGLSMWQRAAQRQKRRARAKGGKKFGVPSKKQALDVRRARLEALRSGKSVSRHWAELQRQARRAEHAKLNKQGKGSLIRAAKRGSLAVLNKQGKGILVKRGQGSGPERLRQLALIASTKSRTPRDIRRKMLADAIIKKHWPSYAARRRNRQIMLNVAKAKHKGLITTIRGSVIGCHTPQGVMGADSMMGAWYDKAANFTGKALGGVVKYATRGTLQAAKMVAWDAPKAVLWKLPKKTFGWGGKKKKRARGPQYRRPPLRTVRARPPMPRPYGTSAAAYAIPQRISQVKISPAARGRTVEQTRQLVELAKTTMRNKKIKQNRMEDLKERIALSKARKDLVSLQQAEDAQLDALEAQAAQLEAEAELAEEEAAAELQLAEGPSRISGVGCHVVGSNIGWSFKNLFKNRWSKAVIKHAGPYAKVAILASPYGSAARTAANIYREANKDPSGAKKTAAIKEEALKGNKKAIKVMNVLKVGKEVSDEVQAADLADAKVKRALAEEARGKITELGYMPRSAKDIQAGVLNALAVRLYLMAKKGNKTAKKGISQAAALLDRSQRDQKAFDAIALLRKQAAKGDKKAKLAVAAIMVAAAGLRQKRHLRKKTLQAAQKIIDRRVTRPLAAATQSPADKRAQTVAAVRQKINTNVTIPLAQTIGKMFGGDAMEKGLALKLALK